MFGKAVAAIGAFLIFGWAALAAEPLATPSPQITQDAEQAKRVNIAGRQRMLTQRLAKAICYHLLEVDSVAQREAAVKAALEFDDRLEGLLLGSVESGLSAEANPGIVEALQAVHDTSRPLTRSVRQLAAGDLNSAAMRLVIDRNMPTLVQMNAAVGMIADAAGEASAGDVSTTINLAGRQRMLSQRIAKDACFVAAGLSRNSSRASLAKAVGLFEGTLRGLLEGDPDAGLLPPPTPAIETQLQRVTRAWARMAPLARAIGDGAQVSQADLLELASGMDVILREMNRAVDLWEKAAG